MVTILTSSLGGYYQVDGKRVPTYLSNANGLTDKIKSYWKENAKVLIVSAGPEEVERNDMILHCQREAFAMSGLKAESFTMCDSRNEQVIEKINEYDVVMLAGGHVPTQNKFFEKLSLKKRLTGYQGIVIAWSAGSMNSAEVVYAQPELTGEGTDPEYQRFLTGLGITKRMIIPHFQTVRKSTLDGLRIIEDITFSDSIGNEFIALNDGSFLISDHGMETLYGEAFLIKDGKLTQICKNNESIELSEA